MPIAAKGKGYVSLEYSISMKDLFNTRTVARLETNVIPLSEEKTYDLERIVAFLKDKGIAMYDTATCVIRTKNTASDKDLQVVEETNMRGLLERLPECRAILTAGQLATTIACRQFGIEEPRVGEFREFSLHLPPSTFRQCRLYRMPSSSRAYPLSVEKKAQAYQTVFDEIVK